MGKKVKKLTQPLQQALYVLGWAMDISVKISKFAGLAGLEISAYVKIMYVFHPRHKMVWKTQLVKFHAEQLRKSRKEIRNFTKPVAHNLELWQRGKFFPQVTKKSPKKKNMMDYFIKYRTPCNIFQTIQLDVINV